MDRNQLRGKLGDELNVIFAAAGFNFRKLLRAFALFLYPFFRIVFSQLEKYSLKRFGKERARKEKNLPSKDFSYSHPAFAPSTKYSIFPKFRLDRQCNGNASAPYRNVPEKAWQSRKRRQNRWHWRFL